MKLIKKIKVKKTITSYNGIIELKDKFAYYLIYDENGKKVYQEVDKKEYKNTKIDGK